MAASIQVFKFGDSAIMMNASTICLVNRSHRELRNPRKHGRRRWKSLYGQYNNHILYEYRKSSSYHHIAYNRSCAIPYLFPRKSIQALMDDSEEGSVPDFDEAISTVTGSEHGTELCMEIDGVAPFTKSAATAEDWRKALSKVVPAVVVLKITACRAFDTDTAGTSSATGFVVDKRRGIILTNRHVIKTGPIVAEAIFVNREEIPLHPLYRDPVHDFGFFGFDPDSVKFLDYENIPLAPEAASVGLEIRVVGNDSGEKISILAGTIARVDRDAPRYRTDGYNDFNTFYIQASSGTRGGSSGSPVIDSQGRAVAMNAGSKTSTATAFYLPLERVVRALELLQKSRDSYKDNWEDISIPRGTLQVTFLHKGYDEMLRLGLQSETEQMVRNASAAKETGMLVVDSVVPGGPADEHLEQGDMLIRINGEVTTRFLKMETLLDNSVNQQIELLIERGGKPIIINLTVQDLHSITPDRFLEVSGGIIHPLSYQQARNFRFPCGLVYVAEPGYMLGRAGVPRFAIIKRLAGEEISVIEDLISALTKLRRGKRTPLEYITKGDRHLTKSVLVVVDGHDWYAPPCVYTRDDSTGLWKAKSAFQFQSKPQSLPLCPNHDEVADETAPSSCESSATNVREDHTNSDLIDGIENLKLSNGDIGESKRIPEENRYADAVSADNTLHSSGGIQMKVEKVENGLLTDYERETALSISANASYAEHVIEPTLVTFQVFIPLTCMVDGVHLQNFSGTGVVVYHSTDIGLIAVDRNAVPVSVCDIVLSFAAFPTTIRGQVVFLHPVHNFALVAYNPSKMGAGGASAVRAAQLLPDLVLRRGDSVYLVGLTKSLQLKSRKSIVTNTCSVLNIQSSVFPRYRAMNAEFIELETDFGSLFSGVLTDEQGRVQALWGSFSSQKYMFARGIPVSTIKQVVEKIISGAKGKPLLVNGVVRQIPLVRVLEVELNCRSLTKARSYGLSDKWIQALFKKDPIRKQVLRVKRCFGGSKAENILEQDDMILTINNELVTCFRDVENACLALDDCDDNDGKMNMTVFRKGQEIDLVVGTDIRDGCGTTRVINWCGCIVQEPHSAVRSLGFLPKQGHGVYIARRHYGSPASRYGLVAVQWIVEVNGKPTPDLDAFVDVIKELEHGLFYRLKTVTMSGRTRVLSLKQDLHYWPTWELRFDPETSIWRRQVIKSL